jgi:hypothetical protein
MRLLVAVLVWTAAALGAVALSNAVARSIHKAAALAAAPAFDPDSVSATASLSLFDAANFSHALGIAERHLGAGAEIESADLYPGKFELQVPDGGHPIEATVMANGHWTSISWSDGPAGVRGLSQLSADVPATLLRRISTGARWPLSRIQYLGWQADPITHRFFWAVYTTTTGVEFEADAGPNGPIQEEGGSRLLTIR